MITAAEAQNITTTKQLAKAFQTRHMPIGNWVIATTWAWDYERNAMAYTAHLFTLHADNTIRLAASSSDDLPSFTTEAEAGAWAFDMIAAA